jgi:hypothetical protein
MARVVVEQENRCQWLLDFSKDPELPSRDYEAFLLNIDTDCLAEAELVNYSNLGAIAVIGSALLERDQILKVSFPQQAERYVGPGVLAPYPVPGLVHSLEVGISIDPSLGPSDGAFPQCSLNFYDGRSLKGRGIVIPYGRGLAALDGGMHGTVIRWETFLRKYATHVPRPGVLFRGQPDSQMSLIPKYFRKNSAGEMKTRLTPHLRYVTSLCTPGDSDSGLRKLAELQHRGDPTMILDWTESPLIAAYFAFSSKPYGGGDYVRIFQVDADTYRHDSPDFFNKKLLTFFSAGELDDPEANMRAKAQRSHFSFNKIRHISANLPTPSPLRHCWDISNEERLSALADLESLFGISARSLGLEG